MMDRQVSIEGVPELEGRRDPRTMLERALVRARLRTEVRSALRGDAGSAAADAPRVGEALADCARTLRSLGLTERETLSDIAHSVDDMDLARRSPTDRRSLLTQAKQQIRELYDDARV
jgi:hypothetical protein